MNIKRIKRESRDLSEELFIEHNINDRKTQNIIKEYYFDTIYKRELLKEQLTETVIDT